MVSFKANASFWCDQSSILTFLSAFSSGAANTLNGPSGNWKSLFRLRILNFGSDSSFLYSILLLTSVFDLFTEKIWFTNSTLFFKTPKSWLSSCWIIFSCFRNLSILPGNWAILSVFLSYSLLSLGSEQVYSADDLICSSIEFSRICFPKAAKPADWPTF